jgi:hypothetical protein
VQISIVVAQTDLPKPLPVRPALAPPDASGLQSMVFYIAHGDTDACGHGCSEWIAAVGEIEPESASRLQHLLDRLKGPPPPLFFHSGGGRIGGGLELGRLIRARKLTVSVGRTNPTSCDPDPLRENPCDAQINAGHQIEAELDPVVALCNSACVFAFMGGTTRLLPPWFKLGIHDLGWDFRPGSYAVMQSDTKIAHEHMRLYLRDMGIDEGLLTEVIAVPNTSLEGLSRDDAARFGVDRREFGETAWHFVDKPTPSIRKTFFFASAGDSQHHYVNGFVNLSCVRGPRARIALTFAREPLPSDPSGALAAQPLVPIKFGNKEFRLVRWPDPKNYVRMVQLQPSALDVIAEGAMITLPGTEFGHQDGPGGDIMLTTDGFGAAYVKLEDICADAAAQVAAAIPPARSLSVPPPKSNLLPQSASAATPLAPNPLAQAARSGPLPSNPLAVGASRAQVNGVLGAPTKTVGNVSLYSYMSAPTVRKIIAGYFDTSGRLQRFARYALKDAKVIDEVTQTELSNGPELPAIRSLLANANSNLSGLAAPQSTPPR